MFNPKKKLPEDSVADSAVHQDLIVHNMPRQALDGPAVSPSSQSDEGFNPPPPATNNFKMVGLVIIFGGLVFIGGLAYLSYRFIIKPTAGISPTVETTPAAKTVATTTAVAPIAAPETAEITTTTPIVLEVASTTAATTTDGTVISAPLIPVVDTDGDGLNDEEEAVLGTAATSTDTNGNSYADLVEVNNNYNPAGTGRLSANANLTVYTDKNYGYQILYPKNWPVKILNEAAMAFTAPDNSLLQISVQDNDTNQDILSWYRDNFAPATIPADRLVVKDGWQGVMSDDQLYFYLADPVQKKIFVLQYIPVVDNRLAYPNIFKLMIDSFVVKK